MNNLPEHVTMSRISPFLRLALVSAAMFYLGTACGTGIPHLATETVSPTAAVPTETSPLPPTGTPEPTAAPTIEPTNTAVPPQFVVSEFLEPIPDGAVTITLSEALFGLKDTDLLPFANDVGEPLVAWIDDDGIAHFPFPDTIEDSDGEEITFRNVTADGFAVYYDKRGKAAQMIPVRVSLPPTFDSDRDVISLVSLDSGGVRIWTGATDTSATAEFERRHIEQGTFRMVKVSVGDHLVSMFITPEGTILPGPLSYVSFGSRYELQVHELPTIDDQFYFAGDEVMITPTSVEVSIKKGIDFSDPLELILPVEVSGVPVGAPTTESPPVVNYEILDEDGAPVLLGDPKKALSNLENGSYPIVVRDNEVWLALMLERVVPNEVWNVPYRMVFIGRDLVAVVDGSTGRLVPLGDVIDDIFLKESILGLGVDDSTPMTMEELMERLRETNNFDDFEKVFDQILEFE